MPIELNYPEYFSEYLKNQVQRRLLEGPEAEANYQVLMGAGEAMPAVAEGLLELQTENMLTGSEGDTNRAAILQAREDAEYVTSGLIRLNNAGMLNGAESVENRAIVLAAGKNAQPVAESLSALQKDYRYKIFLREERQEDRQIVRQAIAKAGPYAKNVLKALTELSVDGPLVKTHAELIVEGEANAGEVMDALRHAGYSRDHFPSSEQVAADLELVRQRHPGQHTHHVLRGLSIIRESRAFFNDEQEIEANRLSVSHAGEYAAALARGLYFLHSEQDSPDKNLPDTVKSVLREAVAQHPPGAFIKQVIMALSTLSTYHGERLEPNWHPMFKDKNIQDVRVILSAGKDAVAVAEGLRTAYKHLLLSDAQTAAQNRSFIAQSGPHALQFEAGLKLLTNIYRLHEGVEGVENCKALLKAGTRAHEFATWLGQLHEAGLLTVENRTAVTAAIDKSMGGSLEKADQLVKQLLDQSSTPQNRSSMR